MYDDTGYLPKWAKKFLIGAGVIAAVAVVAIAASVSGGAAAPAVAAVATSALKGAIVGAASGAATGAVAGAAKHIATTGSFSGVGEAALNGAADEFMVGAIIGAIVGGIKGVSQAKDIVGKKKMEQVRLVGQQGEAAVGITEPKTKIDSITGKATCRYPDKVTNTQLIEVKNVKYQSYTSQIEDYHLYAKKNNLEFILYTREDTVLAKRIIESKDIT